MGEDYWNIPSDFPALTMYIHLDYFKLSTREESHSGVSDYTSGRIYDSTLSSQEACKHDADSDQTRQRASPAENRNASILARLL